MCNGDARQAVDENAGEALRYHGWGGLPGVRAASRSMKHRGMHLRNDDGG